MRSAQAAPHVLTLDAMGAGDLPLRVVHIAGEQPPLPPGPLVSTFFMVFVLTSGRGRGRHLEEVDLRAGDIHLLPAGVAHQPLDFEDLGGWLMGFDPTLLSAPERLPGQPRSHRSVWDTSVRSVFLRGLLRLRPEPRRFHRIVALMADMERELREAQWGAAHVARALFTVFATELLREMQEHAPLAPPMLSGLVHDALRFIEARCLEPLSLQDVAAAVGRTPSHLASAIRRETGLSVGEWLREHRMAEARRRLLETNATVERVADQVGYSDVTHFIRTFRRAHGVTPRAFREKRRREPA